MSFDIDTILCITIRDMGFILCCSYQLEKSTSSSNNLVVYKIHLHFHIYMIYNIDRSYPIYFF